jgi:hypothetical protein
LWPGKAQEGSSPKSQLNQKIGSDLLTSAAMGLFSENQLSSAC